MSARQGSPVQPDPATEPKRYASPAKYLRRELHTWPSVSDVSAEQPESAERTRPPQSSLGRWGKSIPFLLLLLVLLLVVMAAGMMLSRLGLNAALKQMSDGVSAIATAQAAPLPTAGPGFSLRPISLPESVKTDPALSIELAFRVVDSEGNPLPQVVVRFPEGNVLGGTVVPALTVTDQNGEFRVRFTPEAWVEGRSQAVLVARVGDVERGISFPLVRPPRLDAIDFAGLPPKGVVGQPIELTLSVRDEQGQPMDRPVTVTLAVDPEQAGHFAQPAGQTGVDGQLVVRFTPGQEPGTVTLVAVGEDQLLGSRVESRISLEIVANQDRLVVEPILIELYADGSDEAPLNVVVYDPMGAPKPGEQVQFSATGGAWLVDYSTDITTTLLTRQTDADGRADAVVRAGRQPGRGRVEVMVALAPAQPVIVDLTALEPTTIELSFEPQELVADGLPDTQATLLISVKDQRGEPISSAVTLTMEPPDAGSLELEVTVDENGKTAVLFSAPKPEAVGTVKVTATAGGATGSAELMLKPESGETEESTENQEEQEPVTLAESAPLVASAEADPGRPEDLLIAGMPAGSALYLTGEDENEKRGVAVHFWIKGEYLEDTVAVGESTHIRFIEAAGVSISFEADPPPPEPGDGPTIGAFAENPERWDVTVVGVTTDQAWYQVELRGFVEASKLQ